jgi:hypothetical protein
MNFYDCLTAAAVAALDQDVPAWLLPTTILHHATLLNGCTGSADEFAG